MSNFVDCRIKHTVVAFNPVNVRKKLPVELFRIAEKQNAIVHALSLLQQYNYLIQFYYQPDDK